MIRIWSATFIPSKPIERAMQTFARRFNANQTILDIGCGRQPYKKLFKSKYVGLDHTADLKPDVVSPAWQLPFPDHHFDGIVLNQVLEHVAKVNATIAEIHRVLKPGGYAIITVPQTMKNHSHAICSTKAHTNNFDTSRHPFWQVDYYRFTKYGLINSFREFKIVSLYESNGYFGTIFQLINYFFASFSLGPIFSPIYLINNILGLSLDYLGRQTKRIKHPIAHKFYHYTFTSLTINLILIVQKPS